MYIFEGQKQNQCDQLEESKKLLKRKKSVIN